MTPKGRRSRDEKMKSHESSNLTGRTFEINNEVVGNLANIGFNDCASSPCDGQR